MGARGKPSSASLSVVVIDEQARPEPWPNLSEPEAAYWRNIVESLPATWFRPSDLPLLAAYCKAAARHDAAVARLETEEPVIENVRTGGQQPNANFKIIGQSCMLMAQLAVRLRLCPSSRYDEKKAHTLGKRAPIAKPWQWQPGS